MPAHFTHRCDKCDFSTATLSEWEFHRHKDGKIEKLMHPGCDKRLIDGYRIEAYCTACGKNVAVIISEYNNPLNYYLDSIDRFFLVFSILPDWIRRLGIKKEYREIKKISCPICKSNQLILPTDSDEEAVISKCPKCKDGNLTHNKNWIC